MPMTPAERAAHERAAVALALETGRRALAYKLAKRAWFKVVLAMPEDEQLLYQKKQKEIRAEAARLLRECLEKGEPLT